MAANPDCKAPVRRFLSRINMALRHPRLLIGL